MNPHQMSLFNLESFETSHSRYDPYWDEILLQDSHKSVPEQSQSVSEQSIILEQDTLNSVPEQAQSVLEQSIVLEQDTLNSILEPKTLGLNPATEVLEHIQLEFLQWVEIYRPSKRKANDYYRYCFKQGRKIHHIHISGGNTQSPLAQFRKHEIEIAISDGQTPSEILAMIRLWSGNQPQIV